MEEATECGEVIVYGVSSSLRAFVYAVHVAAQRERHETLKTPVCNVQSICASPAHRPIRAAPALLALLLASPLVYDFTPGASLKVVRWPWIEG